MTLRLQRRQPRTVALQRLHFGGHGGRVRLDVDVADRVLLEVDGEAAREPDRVVAGGEAVDEGGVAGVGRGESVHGGRLTR